MIKDNMNKCKKCGTQTINPKFCSRSCSASYNTKGRKHLTSTRRKISKALGGSGILIEETFCPKCGKQGIQGKVCRNCIDYSIFKNNFPEAAILSYCGYEKELLPLLEQKYGKLRKEKIEGRYFDFCNDDIIIEFTFDNTSGVTLAIRRFSQLTVDKRQRILFMPDNGIGNIRMRRINDLNISIECCEPYRYLIAEVA